MPLSICQKNRYPKKMNQCVICYQSSIQAYNFNKDKIACSNRCLVPRIKLEWRIKREKINISKMIKFLHKVLIEINTW